LLIQIFLPAVLSFMSQWGGHNSRAGNTDPEPIATPQESTSPKDALSPTRPADLDITAARSRPASISHTPTSPRSPSIPSRARGDSRVSQRNSIIQTYQPPQVEVASDTPPELAPIFTYLNSHSNKLYQEGYFLKLHDLDSRGRPSADRVWNECFAQLIGTVLSLWDAAALDAAGEDGEVVPTFINLSDASLKMVSDGCASSDGRKLTPQRTD
jgi:CCR4-NOT transcriptional complex subunit CAF120